MKTFAFAPRCSSVLAIWVLGIMVAALEGFAEQNLATNASATSSYLCVRRGPHSKVWQRSVVQTDPSGRLRTNQESYTELATGLCYLQNGQYVDSVEEIDPVAGGAQAVQGRHKVQWAANVNTAGGAVTLTTPDDKQLKSSVYGLAYHDIASGSNVMLAVLQDSTATITTNGNVLIYANAFSNLNADIRYTYRKSGLSQDIIIKQRPPSPSDYGLNPNTTRLQVLTEFFNSPTPSLRSVTNNGLSDDQMVDFGEMKMLIGHALLFQNDGKTQRGGSVIKHWTSLDGRTFLIEEIPYPAVSNFLSSLQSSVLKPDKSKVRRTVLLEPYTGRKISSAAPAHPVNVAKVCPKETGVVLDYDVIGIADTGGPYTFRSDMTYLVVDYCYIISDAILEGGTVIKYTNNSTAEIAVFGGSVICATAPYRPAVFTSMNDDSVGQPISGSTGNPSADYAGNIALDMSGNSWYSDSITLNEVRFNHLATAMQWEDEDSDFVSYLTDFQILNCQVAISHSILPTLFTFYNGLIYNIPSHVFDNSSWGWYLLGVNLTLHNCADFDPSDSSIVTLYNSLVVNVTNFDNVVYTDLESSTELYSDDGVFQTVGAGAHYLADDTYRGQGTTGLDPNLLADLEGKTTYPPTVISSASITNNYTFFPQWIRDDSGAAVDLGYHYDVVDYAINFTVSNATLNVLPGTALAAEGSNYGLGLYANSSLNCTGTATDPINIFRYNCVQEMATTNWGSGTFESDVYCDSATNLSFCFVNWSELGNTNMNELEITSNETVFPVSAFGCQFYSGRVGAEQPEMDMTNNLFRRTAVFLKDNSGNNVNFYNNLFESGSLTMRHDHGSTWSFSDNLFDETAISQDNPLDLSQYNGFVSNYNRLNPTNAHDVIVRYSPANLFTEYGPYYEIGPLGPYYYPTNYPLVNAGSRTAAAAGLYHYTVLTNANLVEGTNRVSIGYHYVGVDTNGIPLDTGGGGIPDYLADSNGNGVYDAGDICNWQTNMTCPASGMLDYAMYAQGRSFTACGEVPDTSGTVGLQVYTPLR